MEYFSIRNEITIDTYKNMDKSQHNYAELNKPAKRLIFNLYEITGKIKTCSEQKMWISDYLRAEMEAKKEYQKRGLIM